MLDRLSHTLSQLATWPVVVLLVVAYALCATGFAWRAKALGLGDEPGFDRRGSGYSSTEAQALLDKMGEGGRSFYAVTQLSLDVAFPVVYGLLAAIAIAWLYPHPWARWLILVPLLAVALDLCENVSTAIMAWRYEPAHGPPLVGLASALTVAKTWALWGGAAVLLLGVVAKAVERFRG